MAGDVTVTQDNTEQVVDGIKVATNVSFDMLDDQCHHRRCSCRHSFVGSSRHEKNRPEGRLK